MMKTNIKYISNDIKHFMNNYNIDKMPKLKKEKKDDRMIADYFNNLENYIKKYGKRTILLWQCGSFYEIYCEKFHYEYAVVKAK